MYVYTYLFMDMWLASVFGHCKQCCPEHGCVNICLDPCFNSFGYIPGSGIVRSSGNSIFHFLRNHHAVFHNGCTVFLYSRQKCIRVPMSPHLLQHFYFLLIAIRMDICVGLNNIGMILQLFMCRHKRYKVKYFTGYMQNQNFLCVPVLKLTSNTVF